MKNVTVKNALEKLLSKMDPLARIVNIDRNRKVLSDRES